MTLHEVSPEFIILKYLNDYRKDEGYSIESILDYAAREYITPYQVTSEIKRLSEQDLVQSLGSSRYKITTSGEMRYNQMVRIIQIESEINLIRKNTDDTKSKVDKIQKYGLYVAVIALVLSAVQIIYAHLQYHISAEEQTEHLLQDKVKPQVDKNYPSTIQIYHYNRADSVR